jgi:hypothetical protein
MSIDQIRNIDQKALTLAKLDVILTTRHLASKSEQIVAQPRKSKAVIVQSGKEGVGSSLDHYQHYVTVGYYENLFLEAGNPARGQHTCQVLVTASALEQITAR